MNNNWSSKRMYQLKASYQNKLCEGLFDNDTIRPGHVIEIMGNECTGKTSLLIKILIQAILPIKYGGCETNVIYFDLDQKLNIIQIATIIESHTNAKEDEIKEWLKKIHVIRCDSSEQLLVTMVSISGMLSPKSTKNKCEIILIDTISAFYWNDQCVGPSQYLRESNMKKLTCILKSYTEDFKVSIIATTSQLVTTDKLIKNNESNGLISYKSFLCKEWEDLINYRFLLLISITPENDKNSGILKRKAKCLKPRQFSKDYVIGEKGLYFV